MLCSNRPDGGFGPYFHIDNRSVLSTCFDDTILIPLGAWLFIAFTATLLVIRLVSGSGRSRGEDIELSDPRGKHVPLGTTLPQSTKPTWPKSRKALLIFSTFFLIALLAMHALEIARMSANHQGVGLLPFTFVPLLLVLVSLYAPFGIWSRTSSRPARPHGILWMVGIGAWCTWMSIAYGVKIWSLSRVHQVIGTMAYDGSDSKYPYSDKIIDDVVIVVVYYAFLLCYLHEIFLEYRRYSCKVFV